MMPLFDIMNISTIITVPLKRVPHQGAPREEKKKNIPVDLDAYFEGVNIGIALAYLYIDDGSLFRYDPKTYKEREKGKNIYLCLNDFPPADTQRFCDYINTKYG